MAQRRRMEVSATSGGSGETNIYSHFETAAKDLSKLYSQSLASPKLAFHAGYRHSFDKAYKWLVSNLEEGKTVTHAEILAYLQHELSNMPCPGQSQEARGSGSHQSGAAVKEQIQPAGLSFLAPPIQNRGSEENANNSQDQEMENAY